MLEKIISFDHQVIQNITSFHNEFLINFFTIITKTFNPKIFLVWFLIFCGILVYKQQKTSAILLFFAVASSVVIKTILKYLINRPRPEMHLLPTHTPSFPSGHSTISAVFFIGIFLLFNQQIKHKISRIIFQIFCLLGLILVPFSRIFLQMHFPSDVIAGIILGTIILLTTLKFSKKILKIPQKYKNL
jgi:undecaprenyl-diphosphatase